VARSPRGEQTVRYLIGRGRLESFQSGDLAGWRRPRSPGRRSGSRRPPLRL